MDFIAYKNKQAFQITRSPQIKSLQDKIAIHTSGKPEILTNAF